MNQKFWIPKEVGASHDLEMAYDNSSRAEAKRSHQWVMDGFEADLFPNKKQAVEVPTNNNSFLELLNSNSSPWAAHGFQPLLGHFSEQLFDNEAPSTVNHREQSIPSMGNEKLNVGRKVNENLFLNEASFALSMSHISEDLESNLNYGGVRKVKVSEVKDAEPIMPVSMGHFYNRIESNDVLISSAFVKANDNPISLALPSSPGQDATMSLGDNGDMGGNIIMSMGKPNDSEGENTSMGQPYQEDGNGMSIRHVIGKDENGIMETCQSYRGDDCSISMNHMYNKENNESIITSNSYINGGNSMGLSFRKGQSTIISFGGYDEVANPSGMLSYYYEPFMGQHALQTENAINGIDLIKPNVDTFASANASQISLSQTNNSSKKKEEQYGSKKVTSNNFPTNVKSLLSTGILDGVLVKYMAWSREKELRGVIKGTGYLCGCQSCNYTKIINAYELERHAGCKTKHPNNHIYFENGKTIYGVVLELRSTPQNMLFDVMQTITGSPINQSSFQLWKESYLAATRELQHAYGKDDGSQSHEASFF